ncbi:Retrovirus-related Pol polyprotein from transposon 17.6 [Vitis vinifera]|uniref:Retrovirus-related Pol polyprotein from transposon 17.6 n=1 Tax=Vitis vinifera TaxID=29760 RepID=A0A438CGB2_VITVI|nr:Retrovirus-related Pol polyprotein from transposon 17.6 [Vitis vinifera]
MHYRQLMTLDIGNDALLCKVFPASLQGQALSWFHRLPPNSIDNFRDLSEAFVGQYLCSARHKQNISTLQNIKMRDNESLREFVKRFGQAVLQIEVCSMDAVLQIFKRSICPGTPFFESLAKKPPTTMDDLFRRANKYSMLEDDVRAATQQVLVAGRASRDNADRHAKPPDRPKPVDRRQDGPSRPIGRPWPRPLETDPSIRDRSKKCAFHKDHGHTTETCRSLQYLVERLIKAGHLKQYLRSDTGGRDVSQHHNSEAPRAPVAPKAVINYINGARLTRNTIPGFSRSSTSISHWPYGTQSRGSRKPRTNLIGFNGSSTTSLGDIILPVRAGPVTLNVQFSVVQELSPFNIILGRTWLHYMKAIPPHIIKCSLMTQEETQSIQNILRSNHDIFAWTHSDMKGIHPSIASHKLNVFPAARPIRQKIRRFHPDRQRVIQDEINKLLEAGFIREVSYPDWLANVVVVPKKEGKWRVCVDYTNLNNACPKDSFPLPRIDQIVDSTSGQGMLSFLDAFSGYHQIPMSPDDEEKTAFITPHGLYCYKVMPFGLKNAGATYQRLMTKIFKPLIGRSVEVYIDDIVVKSKTREQHILHLQEVFYLLRKYDMKLNPSKCAFGVSAGKFLGFMVSQRGIEVSPDQVKAVMETPPPRNKKELQRLTGKLVALGRFIARFTDELRPFFLAIRKAGTQGWTDNCQNAAVLFRCPSPKEQKPVYYVSRALADVETRYSKMELTALALRSAAQKLRPYFQAHPVIVLTDQPLRSILHKPDLTGRMLQWAIELSEFGIEFQPRLSKKGQVMADFVLEYSRRPTSTTNQSPTGEHLEQAIRLGFSASNNEAEYEAILSGLDLALALSVSKLRIYSDSQLVVRHVQKEYEAKDSRMARYLAKVRSTLQQFTEWTIEKIKRADNGRADALAGIAASLPIREAILLPIHVQANPSVAENSTCNSIEATKRMIKNGRMILQNISGQELYPKILNKRTKSGCKLPVSP